MSRTNQASEIFANKFNCSQAVFTPFALENGLTEEIALKVSNAFGGGMACSAKTCGAVTGALMVIGLLHGKYKSDDDTAKAKTYKLSKDFISKFREKHGSEECLDLLDVDISTEDGMQKASTTKLFTEVCPVYVKSAVKLLEEMLDI